MCDQITSTITSSVSMTCELYLRRWVCVALQIEAGAEVVQVLLETEEDIPAADAMIAVMYSVPDALAGIEQQTLLRTALLANKYDAPQCSARQCRN